MGELRVMVDTVADDVDVKLKPDFNPYMSLESDLFARSHEVNGKGYTDSIWIDARFLKGKSNNRHIGVGPSIWTTTPASRGIQLHRLKSMGTRRDS